MGSGAILKCVFLSISLVEGGGDSKKFSWVLQGKVKGELGNKDKTKRLTTLNLYKQYCSR